jgi:hypothetical protein
MKFHQNIFDQKNDYKKINDLSQLGNDQNDYWFDIFEDEYPPFPSKIYGDIDYDFIKATHFYENNIKRASALIVNNATLIGNGFVCKDNSITGKSLYVGSRLHGSMIALINGIPSLTIAHDSRTLEMCAVTGAPYLHINVCRSEEFSSTSLIDTISKLDFSLFIKNNQKMFPKYKKFLDLNGLDNCL